MINRQIRRLGMGLELETELAEIEADDRGRCGAVTTKDGRRLECQIVGLTAGVSPNTALARESGIATGRGILTDPQLRTDVADDPTFERAVIWAASEIAALLATGARVALRTSEDHLPAAAGTAQRGRLMAYLARVEPTASAASST